MNAWVVPVLGGLAAAMAASTAVFVRWAAECRTGLKASVVVFLLLMMTGMLAGGLCYALSPGRAGAVTGLWLASLIMAASVGVVFVAFARQAGQAVAGRGPEEYRPTAGFVASIAGLVLLNEFLMGWSFGLLAGGVPRLPGGSVAGALGFFGAIVDSPWFLFTMAVEMGLTAVFLRSLLPRPVLAVLVTQSAIMLFSPPALGGPTWPALSSYVSSALMIGLFVYLFEYLHRHREFSRGYALYLVELIAVYGLMMAGLFVWLYFGDATAFALSIVLEMVVVYVALVRPAVFQEGPSTPWQLRPAWTFAFLSGVFVAEVCMGAVLSVQLDPSDYLGAFPFLPLAGAPATVLENALWNGFWFFATAAASSWFLIMMGLEMGALVVFKFRESKNLENRVRLVLMMGCYAGFAVFYPSIYLALVYPAAPEPSTVAVLGWPMGIGSYPLAVGVFGAVLLTYVVTGVLVALFGRRVICSVFCTAPLMYQGTAIDSMKSFNRSSPVARRYLSSRFSAAYSLTLGLVMIALVGTSLLSYLDSIGTLSVYVRGTDPSVFLFVASFSVGWYVLFVAIPYAGNYNCVTMGWCYTGVIAQAFQKIGTFRLKVRDKQVCRDCTTLDCAKGCPVGLVDMPGHFRQTGEFRSTKCCGVGDCVEDCPYDNLYIADIRHWVRRRLGLPETRPRRTGPVTVVASGRAGAARLGARTRRPELPRGAVLLPMAGEIQSAGAE